MMRLSKVFRGCAASVLVFGAAVALGSVPVRAADDEPTFDQKIMNGIMDGLGLKRDGEANINYRERAPLVIPSSRDLAPPERSERGDKSCVAQGSRRRAPQDTSGHGKEPQYQR